MQRYIPYGAMVAVLTVLMCVAAAVPSHAAVEAVQTYVDSTWSNDIYYLASLSGTYGQSSKNAGYQDITLDITAADAYVLYVNGQEYSGSNDGDWRTVDRYTINLAGSKVINIGVKVTNHGLGIGNGLIVDIEAGNDQLGTTTKIRQSEVVDNNAINIPIAWWTMDESVKNKVLPGADWYKFAPTLFNEVTKTRQMRRAMLGTLPQLNHIFRDGVQVITGYSSNNVDTGSVADGGMTLRRIEGDNIAFMQPASKLELTDGDLQTGNQYTSNPINSTSMVDLGRIYSVTKMTLATGGSNVSEFKNVALRGYSVEISQDNYHWDEVGVMHEIGLPDKNGVINEGGYDNYSIEFPSEWARYIRLRIQEKWSGDPNVGEIFVFGEGYVLEASYESQWINFGSAASLKNFGTVTWDGIIPEGTSIAIQTRTALASGDTSLWSQPVTLQEFEFASPEPANSFQYRVTLKSQNLLRAPTFKRLSVTYSDAEQPVLAAEGYVTPNRIPMGVDTTFTYILTYDLNAGQNIKRLVLATPGYSTLRYIYGSDSADTLVTTSTPSIDNLAVEFTTPITDTVIGGTDTLYVVFDTKLLRNTHTFDAYLFNTGLNDNAGGIKVWENASVGSNSVATTTLSKSILTNVKALPKVFTPNKDGVNDFTVLEFRLTKVETNVKINIYSTNGSLVATIHDERLAPNEYIVPGNKNAAMQLPGYWDGRDEDGDLVAPGIYLFQVIAETDDEDVIEGGSVVVAY